MRAVQKIFHGAVSAITFREAQKAGFRAVNHSGTLGKVRENKGCSGKYRSGVYKNGNKCIVSQT